MLANKTDSCLKNISIFCFLAFPAALVIGPFAAEVLMNTMSVIFLVNIFNKKNFSFCKENFFIIFILFYFYILLNSFFSVYADNIFYKNIFYFRYVLFVYAISELLLNNKNLTLIFYKILLLTLFLVSIDGYVQYFFGSDLFGYTQIRPDRVSGPFGDKLVLGSYISRLFPLLVGLFFYNLKLLKFREVFISAVVIIFSLIMTVISGERVPFATIVIFCAVALLLIDFKKIIKAIIFFVITAVISIVFIANPNVFERHYNQTVNQVDFQFKKKNFFSNFYYYAETYNTAFAGFLDKKIIGQGPKSFRFFCSDPKFSHYQKREINVSLKDLGLEKVLIDKVFIKNNDSIKKGDILFSYLIDNKSQNYIATEDLVVINTNIKSTKSISETVNMSDYFIYYKQYINGCTTHPHNFYLQLLSETGIVGFSFIFFIFLNFLYLIAKYFYFFAVKKRRILSNLQINLVLGFLITLLPLIPNGNFFNNWLNMIMFFPIGFYIFSLNKDK